MPKRSPVNTVVVFRAGKRVVPPIGKPFDFTAEEIAQLEGVLPGSLAKVSRVVEDDDEQLGERVHAPAVVRDSDDGESADKEPAKAAKAKPPKKADDDGDL